MTLYASGQQTIAPQPNNAYPGDFYGLPGVPGTSTAGTGAIAGTDLTVGTFGWASDSVVADQPATIVVQAKGANTRPVFIPRENANVYSNADINQGWSMTIPLYYQCEVCANGSFYAKLTISFNAGGAVNVGDAVFVNNTDGTLAVGVTVQPGFTQTSYLVINPSVPNTFGITQIVISNVGAI